MVIKKGFSRRWLSAFGNEVDKKTIRDHILAEGNFLWHLFTWGEVPCLEGEEAKKEFDALQYTEAIKFCDGYSGHIKKVSNVNKLSAKEIDEDPEGDVYIVAQDYSWTYVRTHEGDYCGPFLCIKK